MPAMGDPDSGTGGSGQQLPPGNSVRGNAGLDWTDFGLSFRWVFMNVFGLGTSER
jgi:hypothetical protein